MSLEKLSQKLPSVFPEVEMPSISALKFHDTGCLQCDFLADELDLFRNQLIGGDTIRLVHHELSCLSPNAWRWLMPHYLKFCFTPEASYNWTEIEFLIYSLGPKVEFQADTLKCLSGLNNQQISYLIEFMLFLKAEEFWSGYCPNEIAEAISFLQTIDA